MLEKQVKNASANQNHAQASVSTDDIILRRYTSLEKEAEAIEV
jgi:hypothetical protein